MKRPEKILLILLMLCGIGYPATHAQAQAAKGFHQVQKGETYYGLSRQYQVPVDSLKKWNGESLKLGATIRVAADAKVKTAVAPAPAPPAKTVAATLPAAKPKTSPASAAASASVKPETAPAQLTKTTPAVKTNPVSKTAATSTSRSSFNGAPQFAPDKKMAQRVLVIPFDPYLYFSDADDDISWQSRIPRQNVRHVFRTRLNAFMDPKGFESINLLGGTSQDGKNELERIYKGVSYAYQPIQLSPHNPTPVVEKSVGGATGWIQKQKDKLTAPPSPEAAGNTSVAKDPTKYYGVKVKDPALYSYFNETYGIDYYLFINQFEIHTDYTNCLDRTKNDFVREFLVHYTILDNQGRLIAGNKIKIPYISHVNDAEKIVRDNLNKMAQRILADLPKPANLTAQKPAGE